MALRDDLKTWTAQLIWQSINTSHGDVITSERWDELFTLILAQGDDTAQTLLNVRDMLYETILSDTDGSAHINLDAIGITASDINAGLAELAVRISNNDTTDSNLQNQININIANLITLQNQINALNTTFSTDAERAAAIADVINNYELADDDLDALITNKADKATTYTKAEINAMTLGAYRVENYIHEYTLPYDLSVVSIGIPEYAVDTDVLSVFTNGNLLAPSAYTIINDGTQIQSTGMDWTAPLEFIFIVTKNVKILLPTDLVNGADALIDHSVPEIKLEQTFIDKVDAKVNMISGVSTIPTTGWVSNTGNYALKNNITLNDISPGDWIDIILAPDAHEVAIIAELCPTVDEGIGTVTMYCNTIPTEAMTFKWRVIK